MYIAVRKDISRPYQAVQAAHAAIASTRRGLVKSLDHPVLVLLHVEDETDLLKLSARLSNEGVKHSVFFEDDIGAYTALATETISDRKSRKKLFGKMKLAGE